MYNILQQEGLSKVIGSNLEESGSYLPITAAAALLRNTFAPIFHSRSLLSPPSLLCIYIISFLFNSFAQRDLLLFSVSASPASFDSHGS
ncbi:hypothetical protein V6N12_069829 [Hibiscus sabdariffa]|uniref:Uncharacterized protein n=1 Tax=Hibiscus sabdariffa TaxID=183260 RepID=A0ABR2FF18_9ROSI